MCRKTPPGEPQLVEELVNIRYIACGSQHSAAINRDGRLFTFGFDSHNQLGREGAPHCMILSVFGFFFFGCCYCLLFVVGFVALNVNFIFVVFFVIFCF